jgi:hypothetical protein
VCLVSWMAGAEESLPFDCGPESFTIVGVPDTQGYWPKNAHLLESFRFVLEQKALWDATQGREGCNIVFVTGYGDVVQTVYGVQGVGQMENMSRAYAALQDKSLGIPGDPQIPYHVGTGNHDSWNFYGDNDFDRAPANKKRELNVTFLENFPPERFVPAGRGGWNEKPLTSRFKSAEKPSPGSPGVNTWQIVPTGLEVAGEELSLLHLGLEWGWFTTDARVLEWAAERLREHPELPAFISTHVNLALVSVDPDRCGSAFPEPGPDLFRDFLNGSPSTFMALSGHTVTAEEASPECHLQRTNAAGLDTFEFYNNYQEIGPRGSRGLGYLIFLTFDLPDRELRVRVYSAKEGFRDGRRSDGTPASSLRFDFDVRKRFAPYGAAIPDLTPFAEDWVSEIITIDSDGDQREAKVWSVVLDDFVYVRTNESRWLANIRRDAEVSLATPGGEARFRASEKRDPVVYDRVEAAFVAKYGLLQKIMSEMRTDRPTVLELSPVVE